MISCEANRLVYRYVKRKNYLESMRMSCMNYMIKWIF